MKIMTCVLSILLLGLMVGCDSGSGSADNYLTYHFVNNTGDPDGSDDCSITIWRDGGEGWEGSDSFTLDDRGDERTVTLDEEGKIEYAWSSPCGDLDKTTSGNEIIFSN